MLDRRIFYISEDSVLDDDLDKFSVEVEVVYPNGSDSPDTEILLDNGVIVTDDGSLRGNDVYGVEYILPKMSPCRIRQVLGILDKTVYKGYTKNTRASVHVHMNMRPLDFEQYILMYSCFSSIDEIIMALHSPPERWCNSFCLPFSLLNKGDIRLNLEGFLSYGGASALSGLKYSAVNMSNLPRLGTLEFRMFSLPDKDEGLVDKISGKILPDLIEIRDNILNNWMLPSEMYEDFSARSFPDILGKILGERIFRDIERLGFNMEDIEETFRTNMKELQPIVWSSLSKYHSRRERLRDRPSEVSLRNIIAGAAAEPDRFQRRIDVPPVVNPRAVRGFETTISTADFDDL